MRAPDFWRHRGLTSGLLAPLGWVYGLASGLRAGQASSWKPPCPVLCVGNMVAGGAGKTPVAIDLARRIAERGLDVQLLSRGYGGCEVGPLRVDPAVHTAARVGDEPLLLAAACPTWVAADRIAGAKAAANAGAQLIVMDDGFQNPRLHKNLSLVAVDGGYGFGNRRVHPAGPLREPLERGLERAEAVILIGEDATGVREIVGEAAPVLTARIQPSPEAAAWNGKPVVAFAGIGRPEKVFVTLEAIGCDLVATHAYADHHPYSAREIDTLKRQAEAAGAALVTTAKDFTRLPADLKEGVEVLTIALEWEDEAALDALLEPLIADARHLAA